jgi:hypothetical protein
MLLCPEHQLAYALTGQFDEDEIAAFQSRLEFQECEICCSSAFLYADEVELKLCGRHLVKLLRRNLSPTEYKILHGIHGEFQLIYEDFYAKGGYALQPV